MEAGALLLLLLFALLGVSSTLSFYGDSITFMPVKKKRDGTFTVTFHRRLNGRSGCDSQSSLRCDGGVCTSVTESAVLQTDEDAGQQRWCQSERSAAATVFTSKTSFSLRDSGCCWTSNVEERTNWTSHAELDLGSRSDSHSLNGCPVTTTVSSLRVPQNCFSRVQLLAHDPDGDHVRCRFAPNASAPANFTMDETACALTAAGQVAVGVHVFELLLDDVPRKNITLTYADGSSVLREASDMNAPPLCRVKLQFSMEIVPPIPSCEAGHSRPMFLSQTPSHGDVLFATVGQDFQLFARAQAHHTSIHDFQVSGPMNLTKMFKDDQNGKAEVTVSWRPQPTDLYRSVPFCFTAETNETQSDMRCVVVMVTQAAIIQGKASVTCSPNKMVVALEKASMPGIDKNYLKLRDSSCSLTANDTHIMGSMSFSTCGTKLEDQGDILVFKNEINSFMMPNEIITRRKEVKIDFSCQFPKTISISSNYFLHKSDYIFTESSFGSFGYTFEIFTDSNFTSKVAASAYPVEVKLLEMIYMGIQAESDLPNVNLFVESCKATPDDNPENTLSYDLIKNGCLKDETLKIHPSNQTSFNFEVQAFKFTGNFEQVYITCSVILCESGSTFSRCAQGCLTDPSRRRRKRSLNRETVGHYISQGPLRFVGQAVPNAAVDDDSLVIKKSDPSAAVNLPPVYPNIKSSEGAWGIKETLNTNISTVVFASAFFVSLVVMAAVVGYFIRKRKAEDRRSLLVSAWDN
ncbi:uncharacterized protein [Cebidichthys violaceus]|uniref:uncharacterized protein n=1 Tax=Cebidichthys violaceus TaxID=271503 RepID=UPI0035CC1306